MSLYQKIRDYTNSTFKRRYERDKLSLEQLSDQEIISVWADTQRTENILRRKAFFSIGLAGLVVVAGKLFEYENPKTIMEYLKTYGSYPVSFGLMMYSFYNFISAEGQSIKNSVALDLWDERVKSNVKGLLRELKNNTSDKS